MRGAERVVFALGALGEAREAARLPQRADAVAPAGENLVRIGLVADVPDQPVARRVEDVMERDGELDHAQARAEMPAGDRNGVDRLLPQFVGQTLQVALGQSAQVFRRRDAVEKGRMFFVGQANVSKGAPSGAGLNPGQDVARRRHYTRMRPLATIAPRSRAAAQRRRGLPSAAAPCFTCPLAARSQGGPRSGEPELMT